MNKITIGVDVGGTNIKMGLINAQGKIFARTRLATSTLRSNKKLMIKAICAAINKLIGDHGLQKSNVHGIGMGLPGPVNNQKGVVKYLPNVPGWNNVPLASIVYKILKIPTFIDNDVNLITLGEWQKGAGRGYANLLCITLGTGVGGGLILNNALYRGEGFVAGEVGHMLYSDSLGKKSMFGKYGYFEHFVGNRQLVQKAQKIFRRKDISLEDLYSMALRGNKTALRFWQEMGSHVGNVLVSVINLLNPRLIIIGGGVSHNFRFFAPTIRKLIKTRAMKVHGNMVKVVCWELGDDAGLLGSQVLVKHALGKI